jgi:haloalkane dehalogenase
VQRSRFETPVGTMSYADTGTGRPVVFVHGNPANAETFADVIELVKRERRCIAMDHIGFGESDKPADWDYLPQSHARNLSALLASLDLSGVTLVVGDWGGPIGLSWALDNPERVSDVVITNTWMWPVDDSWYYRGFSGFMGGPIGRRLIVRRNFFATSVVRRAWGTRTPLTAERHAVFTGVHSTPAERKGMAVLPRQIIGSTPWLGTLWDRRSVLHGFDVTLLWGLKDIAFREDVLDTWHTELPEATVIRLRDVGHFVAMEAAEEVAAVLRSGA